MRKSYLFIFFMIVAILVAFGVYFPVITKYHNLKLQEEELDVKLKDLDEKIKSLQEERDLLKHDRDYIEKVIRQELGLVKPGEIIYKFMTDLEQKKQVPAATVSDSDFVEEPIAGVSDTPPDYEQSQEKSTVAPVKTSAKTSPKKKQA